LAKDDKTADLFEADGVTPKKADAKPAITEGELKAAERAARAEGKAAALETVVAAKPAKQQTEKTFTRQELRALVNEGKITEDEMDETLTKQLRASITSEVKATVSAENTAKAVSDEIARYVEAFPDINVEGTTLRAKVQAEFEDLVKGGSPNTLATERAAIKIACGPLNISAGRRPKPDAHEETGSGASGEGGKPDTDGPFKGLSANQKKHYQKMIDRGIYKGASDPKLVAELKLARKGH
jgi:hypothetical protein